MKKFSMFLAFALVVCLLAVALPAATVKADIPSCCETRKTYTVTYTYNVPYWYDWPTVISYPLGDTTMLSFDGGLHYFQYSNGQMVYSPYVNAYPFGYSYYPYNYYYNYYWYNYPYYYYNPYYTAPYNYYYNNCKPVE